jgi:hypothetical protein
MSWPGSRRDVVYFTVEAIIIFGALVYIEYLARGYR